jgi:anti-sigma factor ChrR (cupin superfamily)
MGPKFLEWMPVPAGMGLTKFNMSEDTEDAESPLVMLLQLEPGFVLRRHAHDCHRVEIVVSGSLVLEDGQVLGPGDVSVTSPRVFYGPHTAGPEGCLSVEIFSASGRSVGIYPDGPED